MKTGTRPHAAYSKMTGVLKSEFAEQESGHVRKNQSTSTGVPLLIEESVEPGTPPNPHSPSAQGAGGC